MLHNRSIETCQMKRQKGEAVRNGLENRREGFMLDSFYVFPLREPLQKKILVKMLLKESLNFGITKCSLSHP